MSQSGPASNILTEAGTNEAEFLEFFLGESRYGVNVAKINQILVFADQEVAELPGDGKPGVLGTVMFREAPILVVDLAEAVGKASPEANSEQDRRLLLALEFNGRVTGFVVDSVEGIQRVSWSDFKETGEHNVGANVDWVTGLFTRSEKITLVLDFESVLTSIVPSIDLATNAEKVTQIKAASQRRLNIVYCEDSTIVQKTALKALNKAGIKTVEVFPTGKDGLDYIMANPDEVDLLITDIEMPEMDGLSLCKELKENPQFQRIPVIFFSSMIDAQMRKKCMRVGGEGAFSKPQIDVLVSELEEIVWG